MVALPIWRPILELYVARLVGKNKHNIDMCHDEIRQCVQSICASSVKSNQLFLKLNWYICNYNVYGI